DGVINSSAGGRWTKTGAGIFRLRANMVGATNSSVEIDGGKVVIDSSLRFNAEERIILNGGTLQQTNPSNAGSFISANSYLEIGPNGGTVDYTTSGTGAVAIYTPTASTGIVGTGGTTTNGGAGTL